MSSLVVHCFVSSLFVHCFVSYLDPRMFPSQIIYKFISIFTDYGPNVFKVSLAAILLN